MCHDNEDSLDVPGAGSGSSSLALPLPLVSDGEGARTVFLAGFAFGALNWVNHPVRKPLS